MTVGFFMSVFATTYCKMITNKHLKEGGMDGRGTDIILWVSRHLPGWTAEYLDKFQDNRSLGRDLNQRSLEYDISDFPDLHLSCKVTSIDSYEVFYLEYSKISIIMT
jgi:hypothetical protein